jgi:nickel-dependent lactate racemase
MGSGGSQKEGMPDSQFELTYGTGTRSFTIPQERLNGPLIAPRQTEALPGTVADIMKEALANPKGRPRLGSLVKDRLVGIVISDEFRAGLQHEILDALLDEVATGSPHSITVLCATGTHKPEVYAKNAGEWVEQARKRLGVPIEFEPHDSERSDFSDLGTTSRGTQMRINSKLLECDVRVYGHESKHHYFNGYSCVDKQVLPGVSSGLTVAQNHKWALDPDSGPGRNSWHSDPSRQSNPLAADMREAREFSENFVLSPSGKAVRGDVLTFALDMVSANKKVYWIRAGDPAEVCTEMVGVVDGLMAFEVDRARYVVISPGGPPASQALYGTQNAFDLALKNAVLPGGEALVIAPLNGRPDLDEDVRGLAPDRRPKELFWDNLVRLLPKPLEEARKEIADHFELYLWKTDRVLRLLNGDKIKIYLHSELPAKTLNPGGFETAPDVQAWIDERVARGDGQFNVIDHGNKLCVTARS